MSMREASSSYAGRSLRAFWWTLALSAGGGTCWAIGLGAAFARTGPDVLAPVGLLLLAAAAIENLVALYTGAMAWRRERVACRWIYVSALLFAATCVAGVMLLQL